MRCGLARDIAFVEVSEGRLEVVGVESDVDDEVPFGVHLVHLEELQLTGSNGAAGARPEHPSERESLTPCGQHLSREPR